MEIKALEFPFSITSVEFFFLIFLVSTQNEFFTVILMWQEQSVLSLYQLNGQFHNDSTLVTGKTAL